jgi:hypothetical protein
MQDRQFAHRDVEGSEYIRERSGRYERLLKTDRPTPAATLLGALKSLLGLR